MEGLPIKSNVPQNMIHNDDKEEEEACNHASHSIFPVARPTSLCITTDTATAHDNVRRYNIDNIRITPSPIDSRPRLFRAGSIIDPATFARIEASVFKKSSVDPEEEEEEDDDDDDDDDENVDKMGSDDGQSLTEILNEARDIEIEHLSQHIPTHRPMVDDDDTTQFITEQLNLALDNTATITNRNVNDTSTQHVLTASSSTTSTQHSYPPVNQTGAVADHDRPYADYGHLSRQEIAQECDFNLQIPTSTRQLRLNAKSFAITSWTNVSKEVVMHQIKTEFGIQNIQYICIGEEIGELNHRRHLHIQIIFKHKIDRRKPFLDKVTQTHCNYEVTRIDLAWNEYIKKGGNYIEFNEFKSTSTRGEKEWPSASSSSSSVLPVATTNAPEDHRHQSLIPRTTRRTTTVRAQAEEKRQHRLETYKQAVALAAGGVDKAMDFMQTAMIDRFVEHGPWYLTIFNYVHLRATRDADRRGDIDKDYIWPHSFPDCTPKLREALNNWIKHHFSRTSRAKCLVLIGPTGVGKTSFAVSLPGRINYYQQRWSLDAWDNYARYSVYDDIPWDDFEKLNFPSKKNLLTQKRYKIHATDKYRGTKEINVRQPAIVLLNPEDAGSLTAEPITDTQKKMAQYWQKRTFVYIMGPNEYFYQRRSREDTSIVDDNQISSGSSMSSTEERMGEPDEFEKMYQRFQEKQSKK